MSEDGTFSMKEVVIEIKDELRAFRLRYEEDQEDLAEKFAKRDAEIAKRPTFAQMTGLMSVIGVAISIAVSLLG